MPAPEAAKADPLRRYGSGAVVLFAYTVILSILHFLLVGLGKRPGLSC